MWALEIICGLWVKLPVVNEGTTLVIVNEGTTLVIIIMVINEIKFISLWWCVGDVDWLSVQSVGFGLDGGDLCLTHSLYALLWCERYGRSMIHMYPVNIILKKHRYLAIFNHFFLLPSNYLILWLLWNFYCLVLNCYKPGYVLPIQADHLVRSKCIDKDQFFIIKNKRFSYLRDCKSLIFLRLMNIFCV